MGESLAINNYPKDVTVQGFYGPLVGSVFSFLGPIRPAPQADRSEATAELVARAERRLPVLRPLLWPLHAIDRRQLQYARRRGCGMSR